jgi:hypothetical protein
MTLAIAFPLAAYGLFFLLADPTRGRRAAALDAAVLWGVAVFAITEALSLFHALTAAGLACAWLLTDLAAAAVCLRRRAAPLPSLRKLDGLSVMDLALLAGAALLLACVGVTAIVAPPNTTDALVYHLPRIVHWLDNRSVAFYATHEIRQLQMPPWAEYAMLQFHGLTGGDRFDNLVQWFSLLGSVAGVSLIARNLGAGLRGQVLAAVVCATIPQGLLEASGAKNDYVTAFWLVALVYYLPGNAWRAGAALGLACLTKSIALVFAPPLMAAMMLSRAPVSSRAIRGLALAAFVALGLNLPHFVRNYRLFHSIVGPASETNGFAYTNGRMGAGPLLSNALRNLALDAGTPFGAFNRAVESGVVRVLAAAGENPNDPRTTWDYAEFHVLPFSLHEANAGNPLHAALILLVCGILLWRVKAAAYRPSLWLALGLIAAFLLFCAVFRWQPWHTRLHLPLFALWAAVTGAVLARSWSRGATAALGMLLLLAATPDAFANRLRPLLGAHGNIFNTPRLELYFADLEGLETPYRDAVRFVAASHCPETGLDLSQGGNEYPLDVLLRQQSSRPIRNVFVTNASRVYDRATDRQPACLICPTCAPLLPGWATLAHRYRAVRQFGTVAALSGPAAEGAAVNACTAEFTGWYAVEQSVGDWWRWTSGPGVVHVRAAQALAADLEASVLSLRYPNQAELRVNGEPKARIAIPSPGPPQLLWTPVELRQGDNTLEFLSANPPAQLPQDSRWLAIAVRDLAFRTSGGVGCLVDPPGVKR